MSNDGNEYVDVVVDPLLKKLAGGTRCKYDSPTKTEDHSTEEEFQRIKNKRRQSDFIKQGNKLRRLIRYSLTRAVQLTLSATEEDRGIKLLPQDQRIVWGNLVRDDSNTVDSVVRIIDEPRYHHHSAVLVEEKVKECEELQRSLDDMKIWSSSLEDQNKELLKSNEKLTNKLKKTAEALRIAGANAAAARNDAALLQAKERKGENDRETLRALVEEVKKACAQVKEEHNELHLVARQLETRTLQYESEIKKLQTEKLKIQEDKSVLESRVYEFEKSFNQLKEDLEESSNRKEKATLMLNEQMELVSSEKALRAQADKELENSKGIISQFSRTVSDQEALVQQLSSTVEDLREKNSDLNHKLQDSFTSLEKIRRETNQQITTLELEKQKLALKDTTSQEEIARIKLDYSALEKQLQELSNRNQITTVNHLDDVTAHNSKNDENDFGGNKSKIAQDSGGGTPGISARPSKEAPVVYESTSVFGKSIVSDQTKEQRRGGSVAQVRRPASASSNCYLCSKQPFGIMRMCQCGSFCGKRAHMSCLIGRSAIFCCDRVDEK